MQNPTISITESKSKHKYINYVKTAFDKCLNDESKLPSWILTLDGMSGKRYRHFINNLTSMVPKCRYLEIGSWNSAKDVGKIRSEGKEYEFVDGDVTEFRFNV